MTRLFLILILTACSMGIQIPAKASVFNWQSGDGIEALQFETEKMAGLLVAQDGRKLPKGFGKHGIRGLTYQGHDLGAPEPPVGGRRRHQGILNLYRVYSATESLGSLRDDAAQVERLADGARLTWPASEQRPVTISGTWRITDLAQIDLLIEARPTQTIRNFEILPAVYLPVLMGKFVYLEGNEGPVVTAIRPNGSFGDPLNYRFYPLGEKARSPQENSGRIHSDWKWKSVVPKELAALPIVFAGDDAVQVVLMADPDAVSAVCATPLPTSGPPELWNSVEQHSALYVSLFGHDVQPGKTYRAHIRLQVIDKPLNTAETHRDMYQAFLNESR